MPQNLTDRSVGDMFLHVKGARAGVIKGESIDADHKGEIEVLAWSWGMESKSDLHSGAATGRATVKDLKIVKRVDRASAPLMLALRTNETITATLTLRKAGAPQLEYVIVTLEQGRVTSIGIDAGDARGGAELLEHLSLSFNKISFKYVPQKADGSKDGTIEFQDERLAAQ